MGVSLLAVRLTGPEKRRHGIERENQLVYDTMGKASVPSLPSEARSSDSSRVDPLCTTK